MPQLPKVSAPRKPVQKRQYAKNVGGGVTIGSILISYPGYKHFRKNNNTKKCKYQRTVNTILELLGIM